MSTLTQTSKFISLILRHKPDAIGISLDEHGRPVIYAVDCRQMTKDGFKFYLSRNQVWLTRSVPPVYLKRGDTV